jgi:hypothetical protein
VAFGLGIMMLLLISLVRGDLLAEWRNQLPPDAPNYFLINVQPDELPGVKQQLTSQGITSATFYPMVRGRLIAINDRPVRADDYSEPRAHRLAAHDFNLSWSTQPGSDNRIVQGRWWSPDEHGQALLSVELGIAQAIGFGLGDRLSFQVGGQTVTGTVQSVRTVEWDSFNVNFFVVAPPGLFDGYPATYISSFHLPDDQRPLLVDLVRRFPSVTVIDVDALISKVREIMERADQGMRYVFLFTLLADAGRAASRDRHPAYPGRRPPRHSPRASGGVSHPGRPGRWSRGIRRHACQRLAGYPGFSFPLPRQCLGMVGRSRRRQPRHRLRGPARHPLSAAPTAHGEPAALVSVPLKRQFPDAMTRF